jgi:hypothetical protein
MVDQLESKRAAQSAEYQAMLQQAVQSGEAPPLCATQPLGERGCASEAAAGGLVGGEEARPASADPELKRTRGLDASRGWISGPGENAP